MDIFIGSDHRGFELRHEIINYLANNKNLILHDLGTFSKENVDYIEIAINVSNNVIKTPNSFGILICGSGIGMSIASNKIKGVRSAHCLTPELAKLAREHNNANILCLSAELIFKEENFKIIDTFLKTKPLDVERYKKRNDKLSIM